MQNTATTAMEMADLLADSFLEGFDLIIDMKSGEQVTGTVNQLHDDSVEVIGTPRWIRLDDIKAITRA